MKLHSARLTCLVPLGLVLLFRGIVCIISRWDAAFYMVPLRRVAATAYTELLEVLRGSSTNPDSSEALSGSSLLEYRSPDGTHNYICLASLCNSEWSLEKLFILYCELYETYEGNPEPLVVVNNLLCAIVNRTMANYLSGEELISGLPPHVQAAKVAEMLVSQYSVTAFFNPANDSGVAAVDRNLLRHYKTNILYSRSQTIGFLLFARSVVQSRSTAEVLKLVLLMVCSGSIILNYFTVDSVGLCLSDIARQQYYMPHGSNWFSFVRGALTGASGQLAAFSAIVTLLKVIPGVVRQHILEATLNSFRETVGKQALRMLSRQDYCPYAQWPLADQVLDWLYVTSNYELGDFEIYAAELLRKVGMGATLLLHPIEFCASLFSVKLVTHTSDAFFEMLCRRAFGASLVEKPLCEEGGEPASQFRTSVVTHNLVRPAHYGLTLLLSMSSMSTPLVTVTRYTHLCWEPKQFVPLALTVCRLAADSTTDCRFSMFLREKQRILESASGGPHSCTGITSELFSTNLNLLRLSGSESLSCTWGDLSSDDERYQDPASDLCEQLGATFVHQCNFVPSITVVGVASLCNPDALQNVDIQECYTTTEQIMDISSFTSLSKPFGRFDNPYTSCIQADFFNDGPFYAESMSMLSRFVRDNPRIDARLWSQATQLPEGPWSLQFDNVSFRYPGSQRTVLNGVSFTVRSGGFLGIIGYSGAGKTTILLLISRIYTPSSGSILLNGLPIELYPVRELRRRIANCWQEENGMRFFDSLSVSANVAMGDLLVADDVSVDAALSSALCTDFIAKRARGRHEKLTYTELSGGEVERLNIARGMIKASTGLGLFILDESTSALDSITENTIASRLWSRKNEGCSPTVIMTTHRLSSIKSADHIIVLSDGECREQGTWDELVGDSNNQNFHRLYDSQKFFVHRL